ncbi:uncharacterized protein BDR25DRAFT_300584 [Lindgomyces ingoldianus]|uniref:Uncharacterized protein n=1 Tax=Lindgomyces ingoldianus TaxID=673940 RepID=A0ACB6RC04_9PLEO|nr:uncharacterized protein BDR25DRAFT_300584 [Lindgomyces ingoldianus]KAF2476681.1 hypothetical protein BDR25DRAFT_300584 [Lindgomyces ingoldianus]
MVWFEHRPDTDTLDRIDALVWVLHLIVFALVGLMLACYVLAYMIWKALSQATRELDQGERAGRKRD